MSLAISDPTSVLKNAIHEIAKEVQALAGRADAEHGWPAIIGLIAAGNDIASLAGAMAVLARRSEAPDVQDRYPRGL